MKINESKKSTPTLKISFLMAMANKFLENIGFTGIINNQTDEGTKSRSNMDTGNLAKAIILSTFYSMRAPLYKIERRFNHNEVDVEYFFGKNAKVGSLNDDALGDCLDKIAAAGDETLFKSVVLSAHTTYDIAFKRLHADTTTVSFYGEYADEEPQVFDNALDIESGQEPREESQMAENTTLNITQGYNKDHRHECPQVVVGKIVNEHGIPLAAKVMDGNTSDIEWNKMAIDLVHDLQENGLNQGIYIADSKLMTTDLVRKMLQKPKGIQFISRCPANFYHKLESRMVERAYTENQWQDIGVLGKSKKACNYSVQGFSERFEETDLRVIVVQTSAGESRYNHKLERQRNILETAIEDSSKKSFACEADAVAEWDRFSKKHSKLAYACQVVFEETKTLKRRPGRPSLKVEVPNEYKSTWKIHITLAGLDEEKAKTLKESEQSFVLVSNVPVEEASDKDIVAYYKDQMVVEIDFRYYKEPCLASVIFLKHPHRVRALMMLLNVSLLIRALIQYKLRKGRKEWTGELPKIGYNGAKLQDAPTFAFLQYALEEMHFIKIGHEEYTFYLDDSLNTLRGMTLLKIMGMEPKDLME